MYNSVIYFKLSCNFSYHCNCVSFYCYIYYFGGIFSNVVYLLLYSILNINIYKIIKTHFLLCIVSGTFYL